MKRVVFRSIVSLVLIASLIISFDKIGIIASEGSDTGKSNPSGMYRKYDIATGETSLVSKEAVSTYVNSFSFGYYNDSRNIHVEYH